MGYTGKKPTNVVDVSETQSLTVDGDLTISDKIVHSEDTNTAIRFAAADTVTVETGGSEAFRIDSSQNVGIGTTPASGVRLDMRSDAAANIVDLRNANSAGFGLYVAGGTGSSYYALRVADKDNAALLTVNGNGRVTIADTTNVGTADHKLSIQKFGSGRCLGLGTTASTNTVMASLVNGNGTVGTINTAGSATSYNTSSDYRLKENVTGITDGITRVKQLNPSRFNFKADADTKVDGFLAHEAQTVVPEAVTGTKDETRSVSNVVLSADGKILARDVLQSDWTAGKLPTTDTDGNKVDALYPSDSTWAASHTEPIYQGIDQAKLVPVLTAALQEAIAKIETLETKVAALEG
tara:strand:- start:639 stop:1694 length:1056 start_codon:yes stop_codon:yes gene_type:complete